MTNRLVVALLAGAILLSTILDGSMEAPGGSRSAAPEWFESPSGEYRLQVVAGDMGKGMHRLKRNDLLIWSKRQPFVLEKVAVSENGICAGVAYVRDVDDSSGKKRARGPADLAVIILDREGTVRLKETHARTNSRSVVDPAPSYPLVLGLLLDEENDRLIVRLVAEEKKPLSETWWIYRLSTGETLRRCRPTDLMDDLDRLIWAIDAQSLRGAPLTLVHWYRVSETPGGVRARYGARFTLLDDECRTIWMLDLPDNYMRSSGAALMPGQLEKLRRESAILDITRPRRFELHLLRQGKRVTYMVTPDPEAEHGWRVVEVERTEYEPPEDRRSG